MGINLSNISILPPPGPDYHFHINVGLYELCATNQQKILGLLWTTFHNNGTNSMLGGITSFCSSQILISWEQNYFFNFSSFILKEVLFFKLDKHFQIKICKLKSNWFLRTNDIMNDAVLSVKANSHDHQPWNHFSWICL